MNRLWSLATIWCAHVLLTVAATPASRGQVPSSPLSSVNLASPFAPRSASSASSSSYLESLLEDLDVSDLFDLSQEWTNANTGDDQSSSTSWWFAPQDEEELLNDVIDQTEFEILGNEDSDGGIQDERDLAGLATTAGVHWPKIAKRFTVDFNGMQVSYPSYLRLTRLQEKVVKLRRMIALLHLRYTKEQLSRLPQYQRLMDLYNSLKPLLPQTSGGGGGADTSDDVPLDLVEDMDLDNMKKRVPFTVDFMGMRVSYPEYVRLTRLQKKVIRLDKVMRKMRSKIPLEKLERIPKWHTLVNLHASLTKLLPQDYLQQYQNDLQQNKQDFPVDDEQGEDLDSLDSEPAKKRTSLRKKRSAKFNDIIVSIPEYSRLMGMQKSALNLDLLMRKMLSEMGPQKLRMSPNWAKLVDMRQALQKLMPSGHPTFEYQKQKRASSAFDFQDFTVNNPDRKRKNLQKRQVAINPLKQLEPGTV